MKKPYLLPHPFLWIGLALLIASAAVSALNLLPSLRWTFNGVWFIAYHLVLPLSIVMLCFSKEKVEDEMISETRHKSFKAPVIVYFIMLILIPWIDAIITFMSSTMEAINRYKYITSNIVILPAAAYLITFRIKLWKQKKAIGHEE